MPSQPPRVTIGVVRGAIATVLLSLATVLPASGDMTSQGWLDLYNGRSSTIPSEVAGVMAATYTLGMADGFISAQVVSCPAGYIPKAEDIAKRTADMLKAPAVRRQATVSAAVLAALTVDGCSERAGTKGSGP
jgi:hypothetical protein